MHAFEHKARAICEIGLSAGGFLADADLQAAVDRYWPIYAVEIRFGIINLAGQRSISELEAALAACHGLTRSCD